MTIFVWKEASLASGYGAKIVISGLGSSYPPCYSLDFFFGFPRLVNCQMVCLRPVRTFARCLFTMFASINSLTPKISIVILLTDCGTILMILDLRICYWMIIP